MTIPTIYRWDDTDAPVLSGEAGSIVNLLNKCLVEGYGDKLPAGWSLDFANAESTKAAFRNDPEVGTGFYLCVDEVVPAANFVNFHGYEVMTDIDTGIGAFASTAKNYKKSNATGTISRPWLIVATETFFYFSVWYTVTGDESVIAAQSANNWVFTFGDFIPANVEGYNCIMGYGYSDVYATKGFGNVGLPGDTGQSEINSPRALSGAVDSQTTLWFGAIGGPVRAYKYYGQCVKQFGPEYVPDNLMLTKPHIGDGGTYDWRGQLPGLYFACHDGEEFEQLQQITQDGRTFLFVRMSSLYAVNYPCNVFLVLELGADWDA